jgi:succinate dehydrogenase / fumarate reductase cytochrome b subunit
MAEASTGGRARPLSPHLLIWRWHITMAMSIITRVTGGAAYVGMFLLAGWALALVSGEEAYATYMGLLGSIPGKVVLFGFTVAIFLHLAGGVRHLIWDLGKGYAKGEASASAWGAIAFGIVAAVAVWIVAGVMGVL